MQIQNALITGSFSYNGADLSNITSSNAYSASLSIRTTDLESTSSLLVGASSSFSSILTSVSSSQQQISASLLALTASYNALSASYTALSASYNTASSSFSTRITSDSSSMSSRTTQVEKTYASTGSNTFTGLQNFSNTCTPNSFTAGASIYTAGGLQVTQDSYFSSSVFIKGNVTVFGTQSVSYISSSQLDIGTNIITVNTSTPSVRYGGLSVFDSGSTGLTGSIFWDSELNRWIYVNASGSGGGATYGGGMFISGPRNSVGLGCEQGTTACMLLVGQGGDHLTSSMIYHSSTVTCIPNAIVGGSTACFTGNTIVSTTGNTTLTINGTSGVPALSFTNTGGTNNIYGGVGSVANITIAPGDVNAVKIFAVGCVSCFAGTICVPNIISTGASGGRYATFSAPSNGGYITFDAGGTAFGDLGSYCAQYGTGDATTLLLGSRTGYALALGTNSTERLRITSTGVVGIGTNAPVTDDGNLVVVGCVGTGQGAANTVAQINIWETTSANKAGLWFGSMTNANTGVIGSRTATGNIAFQTYCGGWAERMRIAYNGNLLLGSSTDYAGILQANGQISVIKSSGYGYIHYTNTTSNNQYFLEQTTSGGFLLSTGKNGTCAQPYLALGTVDSENMRIVSGGNVGFCTTSPATRIGLNSYVGARLPYINGTNNTYDANGITVGNSNNGNTNIGGGIDFTNNCYCIGAYSPILSFSSVSSNYTYNNAYAGIWGVFQGAGGDANWNKGDLVFGTSVAYGMYERMRIRNSGEVGIGTCTPQRPLHVKGVFEVEDGTSSNYSLIYQSSAALAIETLNATAITLNTNGTERMRITSAGNVGIGMDNPGEKFTVQGPANNWTGNFIGSSTTGQSLGLLVTAGSNSTDWPFYTQTANSATTLLRVRGDGLIYTGLASLSPYNYGVSGGVALYVGSAGQIGYNSSIRESKANIKDIANVNWLNSLKPVTFNKKKKDDEGNYIEELESELQYGLIAEDVEEVNSDFIFYNSYGKLAGVHYDRLIAPMLKAIQEQQCTINTLKTCLGIA